MVCVPPKDAKRRQKWHQSDLRTADGEQPIFLPKRSYHLLFSRHRIWIHIQPKTENDSVAMNERISAANKARAQQMTMYKGLTRPIMPYSSEVWVLKTTDIDQILSFERKILRKICGPFRRRVDGTYRIRYNHQRIRWLGHACRMPKWRAVSKAFHRQMVGRRARERPNKCWFDEVTVALLKMVVWKQWSAQDFSALTPVASATSPRIL